MWTGCKMVLTVNTEIFMDYGGVGLASFLTCFLQKVYSTFSFTVSCAMREMEATLLNNGFY